jgi:signal transduction histidine kinase
MISTTTEILPTNYLQRSAPAAGSRSETELLIRLRWLMFFRVLFCSFLLVSTIILQLTKGDPELTPARIILYALIVGIFGLSLIYPLLAPYLRGEVQFAYLQIGIDTFLVTVILYLTGSFTTIFSFLYLVVIIYASMLLERKGTMVIAGLCSIQFAIMVTSEYFGLLTPFGFEKGYLAANFKVNQIAFKVIITTLACFAVAFLSSLLSEQTRKTKKELRAMEHHVKRVEKMATIGEIAAGLAHEIKNPLASLSGSIQLLKEDLRWDSDQERLMQIILREADRLSSLVNNFLLYARPPAGKIEPIDLEKVLNETAELFEKDASNGSRVSIVRRLCPDVWIAMDSMHLRQILWNLLLNASEAINGNGVIRIEVNPLRGREVAVQIVDNGCGMSEETIRSIFDPFFTTKPNGTGLGLSIVHSIVEAYGCWLDVHSELGQGTTFTLKFKQIPPSTKS